jgi:hypothetical protein
MSASAGMFHSRCSFQAILIARARFLFRTLSRAEQAAKIGVGKPLVSMR